MGPELDRLESLVKDNPLQRKRVQAVRVFHARWIADAQAEIARARPGRMSALPSAQDNRGKQLMDAMRERFNAFITTEEDLRGARSEAARRSARTAIATTLLAALAGGGLLALSARRQLQMLSTEFAEATASARRQAQAVLESEERLCLTIDTALDAVVTINSGGAIAGWNAQAELIFGGHARRRSGDLWTRPS